VPGMVRASHPNTETLRGIHPECSLRRIPMSRIMNGTSNGTHRFPSQLTSGSQSPGQAPLPSTPATRKARASKPLPWNGETAAVFAELFLEQFLNSDQDEIRELSIEDYAQQLQDDFRVQHGKDEDHASPLGIVGFRLLLARVDWMAIAKQLARAI